MAGLAILHHDLEWTETAIAGELIRRGHRIQMWDIRCVNPGNLRGADLVLNRVYASVANRDISAVRRAVDVVSTLEDMSLRVSNPLRCCLADYSKFAACQMMRAACIPTPQTELIGGVALEEAAAAIRRFAERVGMPVVVKRDTSGRAVDVMLVADARAVLDAARVVSSSKENGIYPGEWIMQEFVSSPTKTAFRVYFRAGAVNSCYKRDLVKSVEADPFAWISSLARGSRTERCEATAELADIAIHASKAILADVNALDIIPSRNGPVVIENNPTPNYAPEFLTEIYDFADGVEHVLQSRGA